MANCSPNKIKKMWTVASVLGLDEKTLRDIVEAVSGDRSISRLKNQDANKVLDRLDDLVNQDAGIVVRGMITPRLKGKIYRLMYLLSWEKQQLRGFVRRMTGGRKQHELELTRSEAYDVIEGLKGMAKRKGIKVVYQHN